MKSMIRYLFAFALLFGVATPTQADEWVKYTSEAYGFSMNIPADTKFEEKNLGSGWGGFSASTNGVKIWGLAQMCRQGKSKEIKEFACKTAEIAAEHWKELETGKNTRGWKWFQTIGATNGDHVVYCVFGVGSRGTYLFMIETTQKNIDENKEAYDHWYDNLVLDSDWEMYNNEKFGFAMLIPKGTELTVQKHDKLAILQAKTANGLEITLCALLGVEATVNDLEEMGEKVTGVDNENWKLIDKGSGRDGWKWWRTVQAVHDDEEEAEGEEDDDTDDEMLLAVYGVGKKGSYLVIINTTKTDYEANSAEYDLWWKHMILHE